MDCLKNKIGIRGCDMRADPVLFVNDLPGVTLENIDALATEEQETFAGVWAAVDIRVQQKFALLAKASINRCYKITDAKTIECLICAASEPLLVALWYLYGAELMIERTATDTLSRFTTIDLQKAEQLKSDFFTEFQACLDDAVNAMDIPNSNCISGCVDCNETPLKWVYQTP